MFRLLLLSVFLWLAPVAHARPVDLNTATVEQLELLPGIGPAKARAIVEYRAQNGPFDAVDALLEVPGIGPATLANIRRQVRVGARPAEISPPAGPLPPASGPSVRTVDINRADAAELASLPGIGPSKAAAILADRERRGPFPTCHDLTRIAGIGPATVANLAGRCVAGPAR